MASDGKADVEAAGSGVEKMKSAKTKEIAKRLAVLLLFVLFGYCVPGYAAPEETAVTGRSGS